MLIILMAGAPGCGKGTQSKMIVDKYNLKHLSSGELLRKEIADETERGQYINRLISKGKLIPDELMIDMLAQKIDQLDKDSIEGMILDGFPRTVAQAVVLEEMMTERGLYTNMLIDVTVEEEELIDRLLKRAKVSGRSDDNLETIKERFDIYHKQTKPVSDFYQEKGKYVAVDGMGTVEEIFGRISQEIDHVLSIKSQ